MPINPLNNLSAASVKATSPSTQSAESTGIKRQEMPGGGNSVPVTDAQSPRPEFQQPNDARQEMVEAVERLSDYVQHMSRDLQFSVDEESGKTIVRVLDSETGDIIRQIPSDELLAISKAIAENMESLSGLLLDNQA